MPPVGFEHTISAGERPKTYALDRVTTGIGSKPYLKLLFERVELYKYLMSVLWTVRYSNYCTAKGIQISG
jgi:hypothetical protein